MNIKVKSYIWILMLVLLLSACVSQYGKVVVPTGNGQPTGIDALADSWDQYHVFWGSRDGVRPAGLIFDPKSDSTTLAGDAWIKIQDKATFDRVISQIEIFEHKVRVAEILSPDNRKFGYIYCSSRVRVAVKLENASTLYVMRMPAPLPAK